jgi:hypothetical protein
MFVSSVPCRRPNNLALYSKESVRLTLCSEVLGKLISHKLFKRLGTLCGNRRFVTAFTRARQSPRLCEMVSNMVSLNDVQSLSCLPDPKLEEHRLSVAPPRLLQYICIYRPYWRQFLHPQPEDAPCRGKMSPVIPFINLLKFSFILFSSCIFQCINKITNQCTFY